MAAVTYNPRISGRIAGSHHLPSLNIFMDKGKSVFRDLNRQGWGERGEVHEQGRRCLHATCQWDGVAQGQSSSVIQEDSTAEAHQPWGMMVFKDRNEMWLSLQ